MFASPTATIPAAVIATIPAALATPAAVLATIPATLGTMPAALARGNNCNCSVDSLWIIVL